MLCLRQITSVEARLRRTWSRRRNVRVDRSQGRGSLPKRDPTSVAATHVSSAAGAEGHAACDVGAGNGVTVVLKRARRGKPRIQPRKDLRATAPALDPTGNASTCIQVSSSISSQGSFVITHSRLLRLSTITIGDTCVSGILPFNCRSLTDQ